MQIGLSPALSQVGLKPRGLPLAKARRKGYHREANHSRSRFLAGTRSSFGDVACDASFDSVGSFSASFSWRKSACYGYRVLAQVCRRLAKSWGFTELANKQGIPFPAKVTTDYVTTIYLYENNSLRGKTPWWQGRTIFL